MSRASIRRAVRALPELPPTPLICGYEHALQYAKFFPVAPSAGATRALMQYPDSPADQLGYLDGWLMAGVQVSDEECVHPEVQP